MLLKSNADKNIGMTHMIAAFAAGYSPLLHTYNMIFAGKCQAEFGFYGEFCGC